MGEKKEGRDLGQSRTPRILQHGSWLLLAVQSSDGREGVAPWEVVWDSGESAITGSQGWILGGC